MPDYNLINSAGAVVNTIVADAANVAAIAAAHGCNYMEVLPSPEPLSQQALAQLNKVTGPSGQVIRAAAAGVVVNAAWVAYIQALRAIANGTDTASTALPAVPQYMPGT